MRTRRFRAALFIWIVLLYLLTSCVVVTNDLPATPRQYIDEQGAIVQAKLHCEQAHSTSQEVEHNIEAKLLACKEVPEKTGWNACDMGIHSPDIMVWFVSMNGLWFHYGPPNPDGTNSEPIPFTECIVIIDAGTGALFQLGSK